MNIITTKSNTDWNISFKYYKNLYMWPLLISKSLFCMTMYNYPIIETKYHPQKISRNTGSINIFWISISLDFVVKLIQKKYVHWSAVFGNVLIGLLAKKFTIFEIVIFTKFTKNGFPWILTYSHSRFLTHLKGEYCLINSFNA